MFERIEKILTKEEFDKIKKLNIIIIGIGGVGGYTLETLTRMGISNITIVDNDIIDESNINRQIISTHANIGQNKVDIAMKRCLDINPAINIKTLQKFILNVEELDLNKYDFVVDACDTVTTKINIIKYCKNNNINIISCMGTGNRFDPTKLVITDIYKTNYDPLAKTIRSLLRKECIKKLDVIASNEIPVKTEDRTPGSTPLVPSVAGIYIAYYIINKTIN